MSITIKEIAKLAQVSHTTVSRALNDSCLISCKTKGIIKKIAAKHGYVPNSNAKCLVLNKTFNIGIFFTTLHFGLTPDYFFQIIRTLQKKLKRRYKLVIRGIDDYHGNYHLINKKAFDGIITVSQCISDDTFIRHIERVELPQVIINRKYNSKKSDSIYSNEKEVVKSAIEFLIENGHYRICFAKGSKSYTATKDRLAGYLEVLKKHSIPINDDYILEGNYNIESGYTAMEKILNLKARPTAIFFGNDNMALGALSCIKENKLSVPDDFSIIGFDNAEFAHYMTPSLTTIERPTPKIIIKGLNNLLHKIESKVKHTCPPISKCMNSRIIIRNSVKKLQK